MCRQCKRSLCKIWLHVDFAASGKDAFAVVSFLYTVCGRTPFMDDDLLVFLVTQVKNCHLPCGSSGHQSKRYYLRPDVSDLWLCLQEVTTYRVRFPKPVHLYSVLSIFGGNIIASEGDEWKRYRAITAPAFSEVCNGLLKSPFFQCVH